MAIDPALVTGRFPLTWVTMAWIGLSGCALEPVTTPDLEPGVRWLESEFERLERRGFAGQVVVAQGDQALQIAGYGTLRPGGQEPVTPDSIMPLASLTKPFTASLVLALSADDRLDVQEPLGRHLSGLEPPWADIPIETLLSHTSGFPAEIINRSWDGHLQFEPVDRATFLARVQHFPPEHSPGAAFNYSNVGYGLLAVLIEALCGQVWERCLKNRLLDPAGIGDIGFLVADWPDDRIVHGRQHHRDWGNYYDQPRLDDGLGYLLRGAGDLHASAEGILQWWRAIRSGLWLPPASLSQWLEPRVGEPDGSRYGYGLNFRDTPWGPAVGHTGGNQIYSTDLTWWPQLDVMVYIASAQSEIQADLIRDRVHRLLFRGR